MKANNQLLDGLVESFKSVQKDAFAYTHSIGDSVIQQFQMLAPLTVFATKGTENIKYLDLEYRNLLTELETLVAGHISTYLFSASLLSRIMAEIS